MKRAAPPPMDERHERTLPHHLDAERAVLGAILVNNATHAMVSGTLRSTDFFRDAHRRIFAAMSRLMERPGGAADFVLLREELTRAGEMEECGGVTYLVGLTDGVPRSTNVRHYAQLVVESRQRRDVIYAANRLVARAYEADEDVPALLAEADASIVRLRHGTGNEMRHTADLGRDLAVDLEYRFKHRGELLGVPTGFSNIDAYTGGWEDGDLVVVAARPSIGKTSLVLKSAWTAAESVTRAGRQRRVAFFSLEMKKLQLMYRLLSLLTGIPIQRLRGGGIPEHVTHEWQAVAEAQERIAAMGLYIDDSADRPYVSTIRGKCRQLLADGGLDLIIIDYFQLMKGEQAKKSEINRSTELGAISRELKQMAGELNVPVVLLSQLNRNSTNRVDPRPKMSDLRDTGALEQDADVIAFLHRKDHKSSGPTCFIIDKARNGPTGDIWLTIDRQTTMFAEMPDDYEEPGPTADEKAAAKQAAIARNARRRVTI